MKLSVLGESSADEASARILVEGILAEVTQPIPGPPLRTRGWPSVMRVLPTVLKHLHYQTDTDCLVIIVDSNHSLLHTVDHEKPHGDQPECRLCQMRGVAHGVLSTVKPLVGRAPLKLALGLAVPAIEAWFRCGVDPHVTEAAWAVGNQTNVYPYTKKQLKLAVYGTESPSLALETERMVEESKRLIQDLTLVEKLFPGGFGALSRSVKSW